MSLHGVALEACGIGILITGASGIGKTTAALEAMEAGYFWIADDLALIGKDQNNALMMTGHRKIQRYLHTEQTGIIPVSALFSDSQIKTKSRLHAVIDVTRKKTNVVVYERRVREILAKRLPCLQISIPLDGYFHQGLLHEAISQLQEVR